MNKAIITVAGKGGVGKTSITATIVRQLVKSYPNKWILAIDADPAVGLATALNVSATLTVDQIRENISKAENNPKDSQVIKAMLAEAKYQLFDAIVEADGFSFLAVGRPECAGCYCGVNTYLREVISLLSDEFDYVVIDGEAGIEQVNRRVMEKVTHLVLVTDPSKKGIGVIKSIKEVADKLVMYKEIGVILNRISFIEQKELLNDLDLKILSTIKEDKNLQLSDLKGESLLKLDDESNICKGVKEALINLNIL